MSSMVDKEAVTPVTLTVASVIANPLVAIDAMPTLTFSAVVETGLNVLRIATTQQCYAVKLCIVCNQVNLL